MGSGSNKRKPKELEIRPELLGSKITTKKLQTPIILDGSDESIQICINLGLDVFKKESKEITDLESPDNNQQA
jgi:hypothetical protein